MRTIIRDNYDPQLNEYHETIVVDEVREKRWLFDCDGVYHDITKVNVVSERGDSEEYAASQKWVTDEVEALEAADQALQDNIDAEAATREADDKTLQDNIDNEEADRIAADAEIWDEIEAIEAASDVVDIVGTYAELENYDTSALKDNDIIKVLQDETHGDAIAYYRWNDSTEAFTFVGVEGPYYTCSETDTLLAGKVNTSDITHTPAANYAAASESKVMSQKGVYLQVHDASDNIEIGCAGVAANANSTNNIAIGNAVTAAGNNDVAIGYGSTTAVPSGTQTNGNLAIGTRASSGSGVVVAAGGSAVAIGSDYVVAYGNQSTAIGVSVGARGTNSVAVGNNSGANGTESTAVGSLAGALGNNSAAYGYYSTASADETLAIGSRTSASGARDVAIGVGAVASGTRSISIGTTYNTSGGHTTASGQYSIAIGGSKTASSSTTASGSSSIAIGATAAATQNVAVAIGSSAKAENANSVALGDNTTTARDREVSIGKAASGLVAEQTRYVAHVTAGVNDTDAVNKKQLDDAISGVSYSDFTGATSSAAGAHGLVPAPAIADKDKYLKGDGSWGAIQLPPRRTVLYLQTGLPYLQNPFYIYKDSARTEAITWSEMYDLLSAEDGGEVALRVNDSTDCTFIVTTFEHETATFGVIDTGQEYGYPATYNFTSDPNDPNNEAFTIAQEKLQGELTAGSNISITNNTISATDTTYTAGTGISISAQNVISATSTTNNISSNDWTALWQ